MSIAHPAAAPPPSPAPARRSPARRFARALTWPFRVALAVLRSFWTWLLVLLAVLVAVVAYYIIADRDTPLTTDAYLQAYVVRVAPQVSGRVVRVHVAEGSTVRSGDVLFELDHRPFASKVALLEARVVAARTQVEQLSSELAAEGEALRRNEAQNEHNEYLYRTDRDIYKDDATPQRKIVNTKQALKMSRAAVAESRQKIRHIQEAIDSRVGPEHALVAEANAQLEDARLDLEYSTVKAACAGFVTNLQLREGDFVHTGAGALSTVDTSHWRVVANYRERSLEKMAPGQGAIVTFRGNPGRVYPAHVDQIGWGTQQGQGMPSGDLPDVSRLRNWVPPAQRFQVRLALDGPTEVPLRVGMTCTVTTYADPSSPIVPATRLIQRAVAWWYYF